MESSTNSKFTIIVGPKELKDDEIVLRNMEDGLENNIPIKKLLDDPKSYLS